jgi:DNA-binding MarR family transcriptional regulator
LYPRVDGRATARRAREEPVATRVCLFVAGAAIADHAIRRVEASQATVDPVTVCCHRTELPEADRIVEAATFDPAWREPAARQDEGVQAVAPALDVGLLLPESPPDVDVRRVDELGQGCGIHFTTRPELHMAPPLARSLQEARRVRKQRTKEETNVDVILERVDIAKRRVVDTGGRTSVVHQFAHVGATVPPLDGRRPDGGAARVDELSLAGPRSRRRRRRRRERAQPVAWLARDLGGNRQNVQRIVNDLQKMGLVRLEVNPHHRRASLVVLTEKGRRTYDEASRLQAPWANALSEDLAIKDIDTTRRVVAALRKKLELNGERAST